MKTLSAVRKQWEHGLESVYETVTNNEAVVVVLNSKSGTHVHRYFQIAGNWECSVDVHPSYLEE